jgi:hypothetical protein
MLQGRLMMEVQVDDAGTSAATDSSLAGNGSVPRAGSHSSMSIESGRTMMRVTWR